MSSRPGTVALPADSVCLIVLDGWGIAPPGPGNAIASANTPVFDRLCAFYPHASLVASGSSVGLPEGQMGNSEVGHLTLGAGAIVPQALTRINDAAVHGQFAENQVLCDALTASPRVHLIGLTSDGGVHSEFEHMRALIELAAHLRTEDLVLHCITDGRDSSPTQGMHYLETVERWCMQVGAGRIASVIGRYFAMDRDNRWERTQAAYDLLAHGRSEHHCTTNGGSAAREAYERGETDEFITPTLVGAEGTIRPGDSVLCMNFRPDRMRQLVRALADPGLQEARPELPGWRGRDGVSSVGKLATMTSYQEDWPYPVAFPAALPADTLAAAISRTGETQLHVAETEKYPHVTYFFNGGVEQPLAGERRKMVPSPRDVPTYDHKPQMSAREITDAFISSFSDRYRFSLVNFANADMVGHTGAITATMLAVETIDECLGEIVQEVQRQGGICVITADHGNAEEMLAGGDGPSTAHSLNPVPLILTDPGIDLADEGTLSDVAPTVLELLAIEQPAAMTGHSLLRSAQSK